MSLRSLTLAACLSSGLFYLPIQALPKNFSDFNIEATQLQTQDCADCQSFCSIEQLKSLAKSITVKVISGQEWGSGIILKQLGQIYTVVTNQHVLGDRQTSYLIQTPDGRFYKANVIESDRFGGNDLAILQFYSAHSTYTVASLANSGTLSEGDKIFAAGFPGLADKPGNGETQGGSKGNEQNHPTHQQYPTNTEVVVTRGRVSILSDRALEKGYQIGYTNVVKKGMSGGPLLNIYGQVVGINGMHAYPLWGNPYIYRDGSHPTATLREQMSHLAFAIPIETLAKLAPQFVSLSSIKLDKTVSSILPNHLLFPDFFEIFNFPASTPVLCN